ncbi:MAG: type II secretion system secretin GspD [Gemmobacter sp.]
MTLLRVLALILLTFAPMARAQDAATADTGTFVINLRDADIRVLAEQVSDITERTLILDQNVTGTVTVISTQGLDRDGVWELFQSVLAAQGYAALPAGNLWRIVPQAAVREGGAVLGDEGTPGRLDVITRLVPLRNFPATTAVGALRPLVASFGYIEAVPETNTLVITDTAENVRRIESIARALDTDTGAEVISIPIRNADATEVGAAVSAILAGNTAMGSAAPKVTVDARSNKLILSGDAATQELVRRLVADLDVPGRAVPSVVPVTRVYALRYADAASLADILRGLVGSGASVSNPVADALPPVDPATGAPVEGADVRLISPGTGNADVTIQPVLDSNSIVVRATAEVQDDMAKLIAQLDQRRPQVLIEAAIVEVSGDISEQLGVQLGFGTATPPGGFAATSFSDNGPTLANVLRLLGAPNAQAVAQGGLSIGLARGDSFGLLLQALGTSSKARLLSTPSITTLDNQAAEIVVGQNVPFRTGSFTSDGTTQNTIERRDVGITMRVVPRVNQGEVIQLDISQEVSSLTNRAVDGAADLVTNRRSIKTTVLADNGGTIVLGGLITDDRISSRSEVPGLGRVPLLGGLFRSKSEQARRQTLFVFLRPTILRNRADVKAVSDNRYQRLKAIEGAPPDNRSLLNERKGPVRRLPVEIEGLY